MFLAAIVSILYRRVTGVSASEISFPSHVEQDAAQAELASALHWGPQATGSSLLKLAWEPTFPLKI